jgi:hypothetical protein
VPQEVKSLYGKNPHGAVRFIVPEGMNRTHLPPLTRRTNGIGSPRIVETSSAFLAFLMRDPEIFDLVAQSHEKGLSYFFKADFHSL